ncbi:hypothetical protein V8E36_005965 [Tilletia maclaganii]
MMAARSSSEASFMQSDEDPSDVLDRFTSSSTSEAIPSSLGWVPDTESDDDRSDLFGDETAVEEQLRVVEEEGISAQDQSTRRRLQDSDLQAFAEFLEVQQISCGNLLRTLFSDDISRFNKETQQWIGTHVKPFFASKAAVDFLSRSKATKRVALDVIVAEVQHEASKATKIAAISRPKGLSRADDVRTFSFSNGSKALQARLPFANAVISAIAGCNADEADSMDQTGPSAIAQAFSGLPESRRNQQTSSTAQVDEDQPEDPLEEDLAEAWEDVLEAEESPADTSDVQRRGQRSSAVVASAALMSLLFSRSRRNACLALSLGLFLFASRTGRRIIEVLSRIGLCVSYLTVLRTVKELSSKAKRRARETLLKSSRTCIFGYDNINWQQRIRNKGVTATTSMRAAVHGALYPVDPSTQLKAGPQHPVCDAALFRQTLGSDMPAPTTEVSDVTVSVGVDAWKTLRRQRDDARKGQPQLGQQPEEVLAGEEDDEQIFRSILSHARKAFLAHHDYIEFDSDTTEPPQVWPLAIRKTHVLPLPVLDVDEGTVQGNIEVFKQYFNTMLKVPDQYWQDNVLFVAADAYTTEKIKQAQRLRRNDRSPLEFDRLSAQQPVAACWHLMYAYMRCVFLNHGGAKDRSSFISIRTMSERVGFRNLLSIPHNFHGGSRFLQLWFAAASVAIISDALRRVSDDTSGAEHAGTAPAASSKHGKNLRPEEMVCPSAGERPSQHPEKEFEAVDEDTFLRFSEDAIRGIIGYGAQEMLMEEEMNGRRKDDFTLQSRVMFLDIGLFIDLQQAISVGDPGRILVVIKQLIPRFQATGQHKYVAELLEILHVIRYELGPPLRAVMLASFVVNLHGKSTTFMPVDLVQENFVFDLKHTWPVGGTDKSVQYKSLIGSLFQTLSDLKMGFWRDFGIAAQNQTHSDKKRRATITALLRDFDRYAVFEWDPAGRDSGSFEVIKGDILRTKRAEAQRKNKSAKSLRQQANIAFDAFASGMLQLRGTSKGSGTFYKWRARRARAMGQLQGYDVDDQEEPGDDQDVDLHAHIGISSNMDGFQELENDE